MCWWSFLCSSAGHRVVSSADGHFYSATKFAVTALTEGLRQELREAKTHIRASVSPRYSISSVIPIEKDSFDQFISMIQCFCVVYITRSSGN